MQSGVHHQSPPQSFLPVSFLLFAIAVLSGTCELEPPTKPPEEWEFSYDGTLKITDGPYGRMTHLYLTFKSIAVPPANFSYRVYLDKGADSVFIGTLQPKAVTDRPALAWDQPDSASIFVAHSQLRINLQAKGSLAPSRLLVRTWWNGDSTVQHLITLFGNTGWAFQMLDHAKKLEEVATPIGTATDIADAKVKIALLAAQERVWRSGVVGLYAECSAIAANDPAFAPAFPPFQTAFRYPIAEADTLASLCMDLLQSPVDSLAYYQSAGSELHRRATTINIQTKVLYDFCRFFAVLKIASKPD